MLALPPGKVQCASGQTATPRRRFRRWTPVPPTREG
ncbi:MAG: hypothetical protein JO352_27620 [Chloroflexi bacterium]|nr:hypothetical protein [Chloroflexota bacterium]MBV9596302.1 hypothetical protein [Chloroflexota bacterium]